MRLGLRLGLICGGAHDMAAEGGMDIVAVPGRGWRCVRRGVAWVAWKCPRSGVNERERIMLLHLEVAGTGRCGGGGDSERPEFRAVAGGYARCWCTGGW